MLRRDKYQGIFPGRINTSDIQIARITGPDCAIMCNFIYIHTHTHTHWREKIVADKQQTPVKEKKRNERHDGVGTMD